LPSLRSGVLGALRRSRLGTLVFHADGSSGGQVTLRREKARHRAGPARRAIGAGGKPVATPPRELILRALGARDRLD